MSTRWVQTYQPTHKYNLFSLTNVFLFQCDGKRRSFSSTVNILVTNNTGEVLSAKQEWVKGGEAFNHPSDIMPGISVYRVWRVWLWVLLTSDPPPGDQEAFLVVRNHAGNHGTLSYSLGTARLLLNVMWTSGMNCDHYANTVGVGVTSSPNTDKFKSGSQCRLCHLSCWTVLVQCFSSGSPGLRSRTSCSAQTRWCSGRTGSSSPRWWSSSLRLTSSSQWRTSRRNKQSHLVWLCCYNYV